MHTQHPHHVLDKIGKGLFVLLMLLVLGWPLVALVAALAIPFLPFP